MRTDSIILAVLSLSSAGLLAQPIVEGNRIHWEGDDYYQVQRSSDYASLCEGTTSCTVTDGEYIVINHTTGERFEGVVVPSVSEEPDEFQIDGITVSFPPGDWYQVQDATSYVSLCNGLTTCELYPGRFIVINHSTGRRYESVQLGAVEQPEGMPPTVVGNTIHWADDGWYQVQSSTNYQSICEGGRSCAVEPGSYHVINHTTGKRYENIVVTEIDVPPVDPGEPPLGSYPAQLSSADAEVPLPDDFYEDVAPPDSRFVGDINGDGLRDISVFLPGREVFNNTAAILFADAADSYPDYPLDTSPDAGIDLTLTHGFLIEDVAYPVSGMGDVNGDGLDDLRVRDSGFFSLARTSLLAGAASFPDRLDATSLPDSQVLVRLPNLGSFSIAGDINGDGLEDLLITAPSGATGGVIYGDAALNVTYDDVDELYEFSLFGGCGATYSCSFGRAGDFDGDGYDDLYVSRFGVGNCGFASFTGVVYGGADGIAKTVPYTRYSEGEITRVVGENGGNCFPASYARIVASGDVDGDGASDLILKSTAHEEQFLIFGMADRRRGFVSIDELDGQRGVVITEEGTLDLQDIDDDGFDDMVFPSGKAYTGYPRDISSIDSPVVRRTPDAFIIYPAGAADESANRYQVTINDLPAAEQAGSEYPLIVDDMTDGEEASIVVTGLTAEGEALTTHRRLVPAYPSTENLTAVLTEPRQVKLTFNAGTEPPRLLNYLIWRNGVPIGRAVVGALHYFDSDLALNTTYSYHITPDYVMDKSLDSTSLSAFPLVQRQSNSVTITTPLY